jgi:sulfatase maturation enzyme AslB (radical SAM superfamily)
MNRDGGACKQGKSIALGGACSHRYAGELAGQCLHQARTMTVLFQDPPRGAMLAQDQLALATALMGADALPVFLPLFGLWLVGVDVAGQAIHLQVGPAAKQISHTLVLQWPAGADVLQCHVQQDKHTIPGAGASSLGPALGRIGRHLKGLQEARWKAAAQVADRLRLAADKVPLLYFRQLVPGVQASVGLVRVGFRCNQDCGFCWQDRQWQGYDFVQIQTWIEDLAKAGATSLLISGGEPTLEPRLDEHVALAKKLGFGHIGLETNAIQLAKAGKAQALVDAGLRHAIVSLHSPVAEVSDALTRAPGTFVRTVRGMAELLRAGVSMDCNAVITARSVATLAQLPDFLAAEFGPWFGQLRLILSMPSDSYEPLGVDDLVHVQASEVRAVLTQTAERAAAVGLSIDGATGPCGPPLCAFGGHPHVVPLQRRDEPLEFRTYLPACATCRLRPQCLGVRHEDVARWGEAAIAPLT